MKSGEELEAEWERRLACRHRTFHVVQITPYQRTEVCPNCGLQRTLTTGGDWPTLDREPTP